MLDDADISAMVASMSMLFLSFLEIINAKADKRYYDCQYEE